MPRSGHCRWTVHQSSPSSTATICGQPRPNSSNSGGWNRCASPCGGLELAAHRPQPGSVSVRRVFLNPLWLGLSLPGYICWRLLPALSIGSFGAFAGIALLIVCCVVIPLAVRNHAIRNPALADFLAWVGVLSMGFFSSLLVFTLLRDLILLGARLFLSAQQAASLVGPSALWTLALTVFVTLAGLVIARRRPQVVDVDIPVTGLPEALHGFSIAQISDVHVGPTIKRGFVEGIVALVNGLKTDLIAVTR